MLKYLCNEVREIIAQEIRIALVEAKNEPEKMYSREEACKFLHISEPTIWKWERDGKIKGIRAGRRVLFSTQELQRLINEKGGRG